ncbi:hypothetical protein GGI07_001545 [Coemansia sp. Benny D115]|nr:hypothetical protein GGI07_001545 [Coemansia sp. Benny D115]
MPANPRVFTTVLSLTILIMTSGTITLYSLYEDYFAQDKAYKTNIQYIARMIGLCAHIVNMGLAIRKPQKSKQKRLRSCILRIAVLLMVSSIVLLDPMLSLVLQQPNTLSEHASGTFKATMIVTIVYCLAYPYFYIVSAGRYYGNAPVQPTVPETEEIPLVETSHY